MSFFQDTRGMYHPISRIDRMRDGFTPKGQEKRLPAKVYLLDGDEYGVEVYDSEIDRIRSMGAAIMPAHPGFTLLGFWYSPDSADPEEKPWVDEQPVIGWRIHGHDHEPQPIVPDAMYNAEMRDTFAILMPDGRVHTFDAGYDDRQSWEAEMTRRADDEHSLKEAAKTSTATPDQDH